MGSLQNGSFAAIPFFLNEDGKSAENVKKGPSFLGFVHSYASPGHVTSAKCGKIQLGRAKLQTARINAFAIALYLVSSTAFSD